MAKEKIKANSLYYHLTVFFVIFTLCLNIFFVSLNLGVNLPPSTPIVAALGSILTLYFMGREKKEHLYGKGRFLWSIFFASFTLAVSLFIMFDTNFSFLTVFAVISIVMALILLVRQKYVG